MSPPDAPPAPPNGDAAAEADAWQVALLGGVAVARGHERLTRFGARGVPLLLARLALQPGRDHPREELIELLWPGVEIEVGRNRLRQALFGLRQVLEPAGDRAAPVLEADRHGVRVLPGRLASDAARFETLVRSGRAEEALALYRGEFMPGFYDAWVAEERLRLAALADRARAAAELRSAPLPSPVPRPTGAGPEARKHTLPVYQTRFFGRAVERAALLAEVAEVRLVVLHGAGGSGKTRLAADVADASTTGLAAGAFELVAFVALAGCTTRAGMLDAIVATLGLRAGGGGDLVAAIGAGLQRRRTLLVLDNFEQLVEAGAGLVSELVGQMPELHLLVTSRRVLGLDGERVFAIDALELPRRGEPSASSAERPAVALFIDRARAARASFGSRSAQLDAIVELVLLLEGMPLAIELAAARSRSLKPAQMVALLKAAHPGSDARRRPGAGQQTTAPLLSRIGPRSGSDPRHASMQSVIAWSWALLTPAEAELLPASTVFRGGFTAAAVAAVTGRGRAGIDLLVVIDALVGHSMLRVAAFEDGAPRYASPEPVREFAAAQLDAGAEASLRRRHRAWCAAWALALPPTPPLAEVRAELANLVAALDSALADGEPETAIAIALPLARVLQHVELPAEGLAALLAAADGCVDSGLCAQAHVLLSPLLFIAGRSDEALACARQGLEGSPPGTPWRGQALHALARVSWRRARSLGPELSGWIAEAEALAARAGDADLEASMLSLRGFIAYGARDHADSESLHRRALALWQQRGDLHAVRRGLYNLAVCAQGAGRNREALERLADIEPEARESHDWRRLSQMLNVRGNALSELRAWPEAVATLRECIRLAWDGLALHELAYGLWNLPRALAHIRRPEAALQIAAFAAAFWERDFGALAGADARDVRRVRRLCTAQLGVQRAQALWHRGRSLTATEAMALVEGSTIP